MSFTDDLKRSLGFEETESSNKQQKIVPDIIDNIRDVLNPNQVSNRQQSNHQPQYRSNPQQQYRQDSRVPRDPTRPKPKQNPVYDDFDEVIIPEQSFYEIVLIRPKTIEEKNPVIVDLSFLEKESAPNFKLAGDKIKQMRAKYDVQALLLSRSEDKELIIISPKKVKVINKG